MAAGAGKRSNGRRVEQRPTYRASPRRHHGTARSRRAPNTLKALAIGTWHISVAAIFPADQGHGFGTQHLHQAAICALANGHSRLALMVGSVNTHTHRLHRRLECHDQARRALVPSPGADTPGEWVLMAHDMTCQCSSPKHPTADFILPKILMPGST